MAPGRYYIEKTLSESKCALVALGLLKPSFCWLQTLSKHHNTIAPSVIHRTVIHPDPYAYGKDEMEISASGKISRKTQLGAGKQYTAAMTAAE